jgi:hypothetical protein
MSASGKSKSTCTIIDIARTGFGAMATAGPVGQAFLPDVRLERLAYGCATAGRQLDAGAADLRSAPCGEVVRPCHNLL